MTVRMSSPKLRIAPLSEVFNAGLLAQLSLLAECCQSILTFLSHLSTSLLLVNFKLVSQPLCEPQCDTIGGATETTVGLTPNRTDRPVWPQSLSVCMKPGRVSAAGGFRPAALCGKLSCAGRWRGADRPSGGADTGLPSTSFYTLCRWDERPAPPGPCRFLLPAGKQNKKPERVRTKRSCKTPPSLCWRHSGHQMALSA